MSQLKVNAIRNTSASSDAITLATDGTCTAKVTNNLSNRNLVRNGSCQIQQRGNPTASADFYPVDGFRFLAGGSDEHQTGTQHALTSSDTGPWEEGFRYSIHIQNGNQTSGAGAADYAYLDQRLEAQDMAQSGWNYNSTSSKMTLSFWAKSSVAQTFSFWMWTADGTQQGYFTTYTLAANTWKKITITWPGAANITFDNNANIGLQLGWDLFMGTDYTSGSATVDSWINWSGSSRPVGGSTWWTTNDATFEITGVQLEVGDVATDFEHRSYGDELARCQRYFWMAAYGNESAAGNGGSGLSPICTAAQHTTTEAYGVVRFPTRMRAAPSIYKVEASDYWAVFLNQTCDSCDTISINRSSTTAATIGVSGNLSTTEDQACWIATFSSSARLGFQAEL